MNVEKADTSTDLGKMLHDFRCANPNEMYSDVLKNRIIYVKNNPEEMRKVKNYYETYEQNAYEKGRTEGILNAIVNMLGFGVPESKIEEKYSKEQVEEAKKLIKPTV